MSTKRSASAAATPRTPSKRAKTLTDNVLERVLDTTDHVLDGAENLDREDFIRARGIMHEHASEQDSEYAEYKVDRLKQGLMWDLLKANESYSSARELESALTNRAALNASKSPVRTRRATISDFSSSHTVTSADWAVYQSRQAQVQAYLSGAPIPDYHVASPASSVGSPAPRSRFASPSPVTPASSSSSSSAAGVASSFIPKVVLILFVLGLGIAAGVKYLPKDVITDMGLLEKFGL